MFGICTMLMQHVLLAVFSSCCNTQQNPWWGNLLFGVMLRASLPVVDRQTKPAILGKRQRLVPRQPIVLSAGGCTKSVIPACKQSMLESFWSCKYKLSLGQLGIRMLI
jgi:hypothetical protein